MVRITDQPVRIRIAARRADNLFPEIICRSEQFSRHNRIAAGFKGFSTPSYGPRLRVA